MQFARGDSPLDMRERPQLPIGTSSVSQLLPCGTYELQARMPGGRMAKAPVTLVEGETADVELVFD